MEQEPNEIGEILLGFASLIWHAVQVVWNWSFGQVVTMFQLPFNNLPMWKQVLFVLVIVSLGYLFNRVSRDVLKAVQTVVTAIVSLIAALIAILPQIVWAGLIAFGGAWVITNLNPTWIPVAMQ